MHTLFGANGIIGRNPKRNEDSEQPFIIHTNTSKKNNYTWGTIFQEL